MLQGLVTDLRYAGRMSRRVPVVTISVTLVIALGIAASTAIFSVMDGVFSVRCRFPHRTASSASAQRSRISAASPK